MVCPRTVYTDLISFFCKTKVTLDSIVTFDIEVLFERPAEVGQDP
jgi:hypothetical protein